MSTSRVSTNQIYQNAQGNVSQAREKETRTSGIAASAKQINKASDDPVGYLLAANTKNDLALRETLTRDTNLAMNVLTATDTLLTRLQEISQQAHEYAVQLAGSDPGSRASRPLVSPSLHALRSSLIQVINTRYADRSLLAGTRTDMPAFNINGEFMGNDKVIRIEVEKGVYVPISVSGSKALFGEGLPNSVNIIDLVDRLVAGADNDDTEMIRHTLEGLLQATQQVSAVRADVASSQIKIDQAVKGNMVAKEQGLDAVSKIEDADMIKAFSDLARDQNVLQAAMSTTKRVLDNNPGDIFFK
jgi:flagellar hook-associated protein 3 FlgL